MKKALLILLAAAFSCLAQQGGSTYATMPDVVGTGATVPLSGSTTTHIMCTAVQITALPTNSGYVRWGGSATGIAQGSLIAPGGGQREVWDMPKPLDLANIFVYAATGDKVAVTCRH